MKKRMILALVLVLAMLCMACSNDANEGTGAASGSESSLYEQSVSVAETSTESSVDSTSSADGTSGKTSTESASSDTSTESEASGTTTSANSTSSETSTGTESSATSSDTSTSSKPAENSENSKPAEGSENSGNVDTSSGSGNPNPSQTAHTHEYVKSIGKSSTCTEDGYMVYTCSCGDSYKGEVLPATGHFLSESIAKAPTETERGTMRCRCINRDCNYEETREIYSWNELARLEEERVLYWINKYRAEEGAPTLTMSEKLTEFEEYRCKQSLQGGEHRGHNTEDESKAAEATKCGTFHDHVYYASDGTVVPPYWVPCAQEAWIGWSYWEETVVGDKNAEMQMDARAKYNADAFRASAGHWVYVGGKGAHYKDYVYVGIGIGPKNCYVTVCRYNPDEKGYEHITLDEDGNEHIEWVKD